jgi:hypothetical protein
MDKLQNQISEGARITGKVAVIMKAAGFRALDAWGKRWTDGVVTFRIVEETICGAIGHNITRKTLRQVWG